jgi:hypothetical protein
MAGLLQPTGKPACALRLDDSPGISLGFNRLHPATGSWHDIGIGAGSCIFKTQPSDYPMKSSTLPFGRSAFTALTLLSAIAPALATTTAPSPHSTPSGSAYIESPQPTITTVTSTYSGGYYGPTYSGGSYWGGYHSGWTGPSYGYSYTYYPRRYFFPPKPPALGEPYIRNRTKSASLVLSRIPLKLANYVNEPFYSPLSPFLFEESLSKKRTTAIEDYMAAKNALADALRAKVDSLATVDAATRESSLAEFAREQTPRIIELEATAEHIRDDLTRWKLFSDTSDWNEGRSWRLGDDARWESTLDEAKLMRGAAYFQDGLSPAQRRLLREYAMELDDSGVGPANEVGLEGRGPYFYFSPETSRIRLPANLPANLQEKIATYTREKMRIKKAIRDVLYKEDRRWFDSHRRQALQTLAQQQASEISALEPLAEDIRRGLSRYPNPAQPRSLSETLPSPLANRISTFMEARASFERTMNNRLSELSRQFPTSRVEFVKMAEGYGIQVVANRRLKAEDKARVDATIAELAPFNATQIRTYVALVREKEAIREAVVNSTGSLAPMVSARLVDLIIRDYTGTLAQQELWRRYRDYEIAVLEPGLSPEQRRLLYDVGLTKLDQQLPSYTY